VGLHGYFWRQVEEILIGEDKMIKFSGTKSGTAATIVLRGAGRHVLEETERSLHDALCVISQCVKNRGTVFGAPPLPFTLHARSSTAWLRLSQLTGHW